ncbi:uncharacterized protein MELLADRAFT_70124 [Melampsora larici-populina 98AG31]|uniref:Helitron helicase-like domain-containing protein n=1 Tax=Melampsora larici-populina (strain 98AG31 / pathotype 3-4-7) TaxID=747676 RepID=F4SDP6_MELLP|nr:uncharacterized protein MELLADRAFT_70124 [Melampsora larici-populina 98AG31]EGF97230.1 hypothetical protein MELLADRAFT_70124 [Melampsora larici-populina 98AG31]
MGQDGKDLAAESVDQNMESILLDKFQGQLPYNLGPANMACQHCGALRWPQERTNYETARKSNVFSNCCKQGDVTIPLAYFEGSTLPEELMGLYTGIDPDSIDFHKDLSVYNNLVSFASLGSHVDNSVAGQKGTYCFRVHRQLHHNLGSLLPQDPNNPCFAQIFIVGDGAEEEVKMRQSQATKKKKDININLLKRLQDIVNKFNPIAVFLKDNAEIINSDDTTQVILKSLPPGKREMKTYNKPRPSDVAALI